MFDVFTPHYTSSALVSVISHMSRSVEFTLQTGENDVSLLGKFQ